MSAQLQDFYELEGRQKEIYDSSNHDHRFSQEILGLIKYRFLIYELINRNIKIRYKRSFLGVAWTMLNPLLTMMVLTIVFSQLFAYSLPNFSIYLLSGLILWNFFSQSSIAAIRDLVWGGSVLRRIRIPKTVFAVAAIGTGIVNFVFALVPLLLIMIATGVFPTGAIIFLPLALVFASLFSLGIGLALSTFAASFTDVVEMYQILLVAWMYLTPIIYPIEILAENYHKIILFNPMYYILESFRQPIYLGVFPDLEIILGAAVSATVSATIGILIFIRGSDQIVSKI